MESKFVYNSVNNQISSTDKSNKPPAKWFVNQELKLQYKYITA